MVASPEEHPPSIGVDAALAEALRIAQRDAPPRLAAALHYAVFPGGARVRPRLCVAVAQACGGDAPELIHAAAAGIELVHCASLVHDDLPCFDDAATRRGKPSVHRIFGEALAVLVGDALILAAFETLARAGARRPERLAPLVMQLAQATGSPHGLVAGQAWESERSVDLERYHRAKTGSLFVAAALSGALASGSAPERWRAMGERLGEAYQVADDLLDAHAGLGEADKPAGRDAALVRPNAVEAHGTDGALARLRSLVGEAASAVPECDGAAALRILVVQLAERLVPASLRQSAA